MFFSSAVAMAMAAVLLYAASEKARGLSPLAATIAALGAPQRAARPLALTVTFAELAIATAILFRPEADATHLAVAGLAVLFALAGLVALRSDEPIRCSCFGSGSRFLGTAQLVALIPWLGGVAVLRAGYVTAPTLIDSAVMFAATSLVVALIRVPAVWNAIREARGDRCAAQEMNEWLPSY